VSVSRRARPPITPTTPPITSRATAPIVAPCRADDRAGTLVDDSVNHADPRVQRRPRPPGPDISSS
jgi:hypothetical protein